MATRLIGPLSVSEAGTPDRQPLLFLHGIGSSRLAFADQLTHFSQHPTMPRWCLAPDAPGYGDSDDDLGIESLDDYVAHVIALLEAVGASRADVVGVSWGGVITTRLAATYPERIRRIVLADTSRGSGRDPDKAAAMRSRDDALRGSTARALADSRAPRLLSASAPPGLIQRVADDMASAIRLPGYGQAARSMADTDNSELLTTITCPTLVVVGDADIVCPVSEAEILTGLVPNASLEIITEAGHLANREQPNRFNQAIERFLAATEHNN